jgi:hypothetical protein
MSSDHPVQFVHSDLRVPHNFLSLCDSSHSFGKCCDIVQTCVEQNLEVISKQRDYGNGSHEGGPIDNFFQVSNLCEVPLFPA